MSTNYDNEIRMLELKCRLEGQMNALTKIDLDLLRMKKREEEYEDTKKSLNEEIQKTKEEMKNAIIGFFQESKAEKAIEALARSLNSEATVIRSSQTQRVSSTSWFPGIS